MKKIISYLFFLSLFTYTYASDTIKSYNAYYDVLTLKSYHCIKDGKITFTGNNDTDQVIISILGAYLVTNANNLTPTDLKRAFDPIGTDTVDPNPFINIDVSQLRSSPPEFPFSNLKSSLSTIGGIDVTTFSQGLSQFMIGRAKEELNVAFFQKFKNFFEKEENKEIRTLFPETTTKIGNLLSYQYQQMLPELQAAFQQDMEQLPDNIINVLLLPENYDRINRFPEFLVVINLFNKLDQLDQLSPPEWFTALPTVAQFGKPAIDTLPGIQNLYTVLKLSEILSNSVRSDTMSDDRNKHKYWVSSKDFYHNIISDPVTQELYVGLVYQNIRNENLKINGKLISDMIRQKDVNRELIWFNNLLSGVLEQFDKVNTAAEEIKNMLAKGTRPGPEDYYTYVNTTVAMAGSGFEIAQHLQPEADIQMKYITLVNNANELYKNTYSKNYVLAIGNALDLLNDINDALKERDIVLIKSHLMKKVNTYGRFIGYVAGAKSPDDVKNAISAVALPSGSSSIKKNSYLDISVGGYLGINYRSNYDENKASDAWNSQWVITAPIGLSVSTGFKRWGSASLTGVLLDVGAIVDYQLSNDSTRIERKITLGNIVSPGLYLVYGFPLNLPLAIGIGAQYGPGLSSINKTDNTPVINSSDWRVGAFIAVDIPMFTIYNVPKRK